MTSGAGLRVDAHRSVRYRLLDEWDDLHRVSAKPRNITIIDNLPAHGAKSYAKASQARSYAAALQSNAAPGFTLSQGFFLNAFRGGESGQDSRQLAMPEKRHAATMNGEGSDRQRVPGTRPSVLIS